MTIHIGSDFDDFLASEDLAEEVSAAALKRVIAWQIAEAMKAQKISKKALAERMHTSRTAVDRALDQNDSGMTLATLASAARALGHRAGILIHDPDGSVPDRGHHHLAAVTARAVLCEVDRLPGAKQQAVPRERHGQRISRKHGLDVRRHVVGPFVVVLVLRTLGREPVEPSQKIALDRRAGILTDEHTRAGMATEYRERALHQPGLGEPDRNLRSDIDQPGPGRLYPENALRGPHYSPARPSVRCAALR